MQKEEKKKGRGEVFAFFSKKRRQKEEFEEPELLLLLLPLDFSNFFPLSKILQTNTTLSLSLSNRNVVPILDESHLG